MTPGYELREELGSDPPFVLRRALRRSDRRPVLLKTLGAQPRDEAKDAHALLKRDHEIGRQLEIAKVPPEGGKWEVPPEGDKWNIPRAMDLLEVEGRPALVFEDRGGQPLDLLLSDGPLSPRAALEVGLGLAAALTALHRQGLVHRDLRPPHVWVHPRRQSVELTGLGRASRVPRELAPPRDRRRPAAAYLSPEQTGRSHRLVDYRTDFYSLGAVLFEMLTGRPPFVDDDPLALVHAQMARQPPRACELVPAVPETVSEIVHKLLAKAAEDRYQSGSGLIHDLERCLRELAAGELEPFELGEADVPERFELPQRLYGRRREVARLDRAFEGARRGSGGRERAALLLVAGYSGVGKTSLIHRLRRQVFLAGGNFAAGKYEELEHDVPYSALLAALRQLVRLLLGEPDGQLAGRRRRLSEALGANLGVLAEVIPELEVLLGTTSLGGVPEVETLPPVAASNRFRLSIRRFLGALATAEHPLVLFLDDLQWIDASSLELLTDALSRWPDHLLLLGAYRDNEVGERHPLRQSLDAMRAHGIPVETLILSPLNAGAVSRLVADALRAREERAAPLAELVYRRTAGNPFFVKSFLASLHQQGLLSLDPEHAGWSWDLAGIAALPATDNVVELTSQRFAQLPEAHRQALARAAAFGRRFDVATMAALLELPPAIAEAHLIEACRERILLKEGEHYRFVHDRVRETAYALLPRPERAPVHRRIAAWLKQRAGHGEVPLFELADHLNRARELLADPGERAGAARLNLEAGRRARSAAAFPAAEHYFTAGLRLLGPGDWSARYELSLALHAEAAQAAYLTADFSAALRLARVVHDRARACLDEVAVYETEAAVALARHRGEESVRCCLAALQGLGVEIPEAPTPEEAAAAVERVDRAARARLATDPRQVPALEDPVRLAAQRLLIRLCIAARWRRDALLELWLCRIIEITLDGGHGPQAALAYVFLGYLRGNLLNDPAGGERAGAYGLALLDHQHVTGGIRPLCQAIFHALVRSRWTHPAALLEPMEATFRLGVESGDLDAAGASAFQRGAMGLLCGEPLPRLEQTIRHACRELAGLGQRMFAEVLRRLLRLTLELQGRPDDGDPAGAPGEPRAGGDGGGRNSQVEVRLAGPEMMVRHLLRQAEPALGAAVDSDIVPEETLPGIPIDFYRSLIFLDRHPQLSAEERRAHLARAEPCRERLAARAASTPDLDQHRLDLVDAEHLRARGRIADALARYQKAADGARRHRFPAEEALALERFGESLLELGARYPGMACLRRAAEVYRRWGAGAKVTDLEGRYPELAAAETVPAPETVPAASAAGSSEASPDALDLLSLERAARALAATLDLGQLWRELLTVVLQNTGAERGFLLRAEEDGRLMVAARAGTGGGIEILHGQPLADREDDLAATVARTVSRTGETLVLADARSDPCCAGDPYVVAAGPRSILCAPVVHRRKTLALLYLEHGRMAGVFSQQHLGALRIIASHAAVALRNALLHDALSGEVTSRRQAEDDLRRALDDVARLKDRLDAENVYLQEEIRGSHDFEEIVGESAALRRVLEQVEQVAATNATVLILGETGTGKELIARAIHGRSARRERTLVKVNCAALPAALIESELFGHEKGAFTGALRARAGRFELADGGTLFLDEIGDLSPEIQVKLLRVLQEGEMERLGSSRARRVDVRVIAATHRDLEQMVADGSFRADLYYRLRVVPLALPALRQRSEDIPLLVRHFVGKGQARLGKVIESIPAEAMERLTAYHWPGNVRELENVIERAVILSPGAGLLVDETFAPLAPTATGSLEDVERAHIVKVLVECGWRIKGRGGAAERLDMNPGTLYSRMKKLGIQRPR